MKSILLLIMLTSTTFSHAEETCIYMSSTVSIGSNISAPTNDRYYGRINDHPILFRFLPGTLGIKSTSDFLDILETYGIGIIPKSEHKGCFDTNQLFIGTNKFSAKIDASAWRNQIKGSLSVTYYLYKNTNQVRLLCQDNLYAGHEYINCAAEIPLTLRELNPEAANEIDGYKSKIAALKAQGEQLNKEGLKEAEELEYKLDSLALIDPENLNSDELVKIDVELNEISEKLNSMQKSLEEMRAQYQKSLAETIDSIKRIQKNAVDQLNITSINVKDPSFYAQNTLSELQIPSLQIDRTDSKSDFNETSNPYLDLQNSVLSKLTNFAAKQDVYNFNLTVRNWTDNVNLFNKIIIIRGASVTLKELNVFNNSIAKVKAFIESNSPKNSNIPEDVKRTIDEDIKPKEPEKAEELKSALSNWNNIELTAKQKLVLTTIRAIGTGYQNLDNLEDDRVEAKAMLGRVLSQAIDVVKDLSRLAVAFTPLNDFVDFCEVVTGRQFCLPNQNVLSTSERAFTAIGLFIGTGNFWRGLGDKITGGMRNTAEIISHEAAALVNAEKKTIKNVTNQLLNQGLKLSSKQKKYMVKLLKSDGSYNEAKICSILLKYGELEKNIFKVKPATIENLVVTRGKKVAYYKDVKDFTEIKRNMFKMDQYSLEGSGRWSIGGKRLTGDNAIYTVIGEGKEIEQVLTKEMRIGNISEAITSTKKVSSKNILDLSDKTVLDSLGVELKDLLKDDSIQGAYDLTQAIGNLAIEAGYDAIIAISQKVKSNKILVILKEGV